MYEIGIYFGMLILSTKVAADNGTDFNLTTIFPGLEIPL